MASARDWLKGFVNQMTLYSGGLGLQTEAPAKSQTSLTPAAEHLTILPDDAGPIDHAHLAEQTQGDASLQTELLALFAQQARAIAAELTTGAAPAGGTPRDRATLLHTLSGSARAVGAWAVAASAHQLEAEIRRCVQPAPGFARLLASVADACSSIDGNAAAQLRPGDPRTRR